MDIALGTETRGEYLGLEVAKSARKLVEEIALVKKDENVVITADTSSDMRVVAETAKAVYAADAIPTIILYHTNPTAVMEPPAPVAGAIKESDVWIEYAVSYIQHTRAWRAALDNGTRYLCLPGMDVTMMVNTIGRVDYNLLIVMSNLLKEIVQKADKVEIKSPGGTDLIAYNRGRRARVSGKLADKKGEPVMLGGQVSWCPTEETINGKIVFDGAVWPPAELGKLSSRIKLTIENGVATKIDGDAEARVFERWMAGFNDPTMYRVAHYSLGFSPRITKPTGRIVEDERVFGCIEFGLGSQGAQIMGKTWSSASHTDGIVLNPTIILDGEVIEEEGVYVKEEIREYCRKLGVPGY
ncbi:MAG: hypothetical protein QME46_02645 [Thermoanaerobacteraceae bacterium]|nr:hypothetical protein [Thermoanaerobacteraceae bacterium]